MRSCTIFGSIIVPLLTINIRGIDLYSVIVLLFFFIVVLFLVYKFNDNFNKDRKWYLNILNKIQNNAKTIGVILLGIFIMLLLVRHYYIDSIFPWIFFLVPVIFLLTYPKFSKHHKKLAVILVCCSLCILFYCIYCSYYVYPILSDLYLSQKLAEIPKITMVANFRFNYMILSVYSIANIILAYILYNDKFSN